MCADNLQIDPDLPHLNKTSSVVVNEQFKVRIQAATKYKFVSTNTRKASTEGKVAISRENIMVSVSDSLQGVQPPQILRAVVDQHGLLALNQTKKQNSSTTNLHGLNRSVAEKNLNKSTTTGSSKPRKIIENPSVTSNYEERNSIAQKVDLRKFSGNHDERQSITHLSISKSFGKECRQKKSLSSANFAKAEKSEKKQSFKLLHQSQENFNSQISAVSSSMEFAHSSHLRVNNSTVILKSKNAASRGKSNLTNVSVGASGKPVIPKTPQTSTKLKMLSARKQKSLCT